MPPLADGVYEVMVVDVSSDRHPGARLDLVITSGEHKGEVVVVRAGGLTDDPLLLGLPARLTVKDGQPQVQIYDEHAGSRPPAPPPSSAGPAGGGSGTSRPRPD
jgi:hypothetical protein